jgi:hypothetical protein
MNLKPEQLQTLKADILANQDPAIVAALAEGNDGAIAEWYNQEVTPVTKVWRPDVTVNEFSAAIVWTDFLALTTNQILTYQSIIWSNTIDMTDPQIRQGLTSIFGAGSTSMNQINSRSQKNGTRIEILFATGGTVKVTPFYKQTLTDMDVRRALTS